MTEAYEKILLIDVGGTSIKAAIFSRDSKLQQEYKKLPNPSLGTPATLLKTKSELVKDFSYDMVAAGFAECVKNDIIKIVPDLRTDG